MILDFGKRGPKLGLRAENKVSFMVVANAVPAMIAITYCTATATMPSVAVPVVMELLVVAVPCIVLWLIYAAAVVVMTALIAVHANPLLFLMHADKLYLFAEPVLFCLLCTTISFPCKLADRDLLSSIS